MSLPLIFAHSLGQTASLVMEKDVSALSGSISVTFSRGFFARHCAHLRSYLGAEIALSPTGPGVGSLEKVIWSRRRWADLTLKAGVLFMVFSVVYYNYLMSQAQQDSNNVEVVVSSTRGLP